MDAPPSPTPRLRTSALAWSGVVLASGAALLGLLSALGALSGEHGSTRDPIRAFAESGGPPIILSVAALAFAVAALVRTRSADRRHRDDVADASADARREAEAASRELALLRAAVDEHTLFSVADRTGTIIDVNQGFCEISGYTRDELIGRDHRILNSGHHPKAFWVEMWRTISSGRPWRAEVCNRAKDGSLYWVDSTNIPQFGPDGKIRCYISLRFDVTESRRVQAELASTKLCLEETGRIAKVGGWELDLSTNRPVWTDEVCRIHEVEPGYVPDLSTAIDFYAPEYRQVIADCVRRAIEHGEHYDVEAELITARGRRIWVRAQGAPYFDDDGRCTLLRGAFQEITERVEAARKHEALRERFERAITGTSDGLWDYVPATGEIWYADQFKALLGFEPHEHDRFEPTLASFVGLLHPDDRAAMLGAIRAHLREDAPYEVEHRLRTRDGNYRWFMAKGRASRDAEGNVERISGSISDVHQRRTMQSRFDLATRVSSIGLWDWDVETDETFFSDTFYTMLGYEPGELPMCLQTWVDLVHPDDLQNALGDIKRHMAGETDQYLNEHRLRTKSGEWVWIRDVGELVERLEDGTPKRMIGVHIDIQEMRDALDAANRANSAKSEFLANMSHEIRTPMTAILGYADLLDGDFAGDPEGAAEAARTIQSNASHLLTIINDILDVSKIEAGQLRVERIQTDAARVVDEAASLIRPLATGKGLDLRVFYDTPIPETITSDPTRLRQILVNLAGNAVKFTELGAVDIRVACDPESRTMRFRVVDSGVGMSPEACAKISRFEAFTQADSSTTRRFGGTGLGLRISTGLAKILGGSIEIESTEGEGSTFSFTVATGDLSGVRMIDPASADDERDAAPDAPPPEPLSGPTPPPLFGVRVLLAEDGPDNQRLISHHLRKAGAEVTVCENGLIAAETVERLADDEKPDLVLMDMQMPVLDGYAATERLRAGGCRLPILALTAHAMDGDRAKCLNAGCTDYLTKPIDRHALISCCESHAGGRGALRQAS